VVVGVFGKKYSLYKLGYGKGGLVKKKKGRRWGISKTKGINSITCLVVVLKLISLKLRRLFFRPLNISLVPLKLQKCP